MRYETSLKLSILTPARNVAAYVSEAINSVVRERRMALEHIIIDDSSSDDTLRIITEAAAKDDRVRIFSNPGKGKVTALNFAFGKARGDIITTLDADDVLHPRYFTHLLDCFREKDAMIRNYWITDDKLRIKSVSCINTAFLKKSFRQNTAELIGLPRAAWTLSRNIAERVFPIPEELPFEDVWVSLMVKRYAVHIAYCRQPSYYYRQHEGQIFGGILNAKPGIVRYRAGRLYKYSELLPRFADRFGLKELQDLRETKKYYELLMGKQFQIEKVMTSRLNFMKKVNLVLFRRLWFLIPILRRLQWALARLIF